MSVARQAPKKFKAEEAENFEDVRLFALIYGDVWNILERRRGSELRLTKFDDQILEHLYSEFPDFDPAAEIDENKMKNKEGKEKWRSFMMKYEKTVEDYNFGTLLRRHSREQYGEASTMFAPRMQFYAVEIARNKKGLNDWIYEDAQKAEEKK